MNTPPYEAYSGLDSQKGGPQPLLNSGCSLSDFNNQLPPTQPAYYDTEITVPCPVLK